MDGIGHAKGAILKSDEEYLGEICSILDSVGSDLHNFAENASSVTVDLQHDPKLQTGTRTLLSDGKAMGESLLASKEEAEKMAKLQARYDELLSKWQAQQEQLGRAQAEVFRLKNQVMHQSTFCASLGAVLGNLGWRASHFPQIIEAWLSRNKVGELLCIVNGTFVSFINTYGAIFPPMTSDEYQFVMGLCGIVTNMSACPEGRQFLVTNPNGKDLIQKLVKLAPSVPLPSGSALKRLILMLLYNVSVNQTGLQYLFELRVTDVLGECLEESVPQELQLLCLRLLQSITYGLDDSRILHDILKSLPIRRIESIAESDEDRLKTIAGEVLENLRKARTTVKQST